MNSWSSPSTAVPTLSRVGDPDAPKYRALVVDSGPIIKEGLSVWKNRAQKLYTVPAVIAEIRDSKARQWLSQELDSIQVREASPTSFQRIVEFSKQTGDYPSLSPVDLQVLALTLDLEREGCFGLDHIRTTPKRTIGLGNITTLNLTKKNEAQEQEIEEIEGSDDDTEGGSEDGDETAVQESVALEASAERSDHSAQQGATTTISSWAKLVNPQEGSSKVKVKAMQEINETSRELASTSLSDTDQFADAQDDERDLDPQVAKELESDFPSLAAAATVPYEGDDNEISPKEAQAENNEQKGVSFAEEDGKEQLAKERELERLERERQKEEALKPVSRSGKTYNSFRKYGHLMKPAPPKSKKITKPAAVAPEPQKQADDVQHPDADTKSRILGPGMSMATTEMKAEDDDGEGWITNPKEIQTLKNAGSLDPAKGSSLSNLNGDAKKEPQGPPRDQRAACTTTDFSMQNVLLQMGLILLSVDGMQIRRLKSWVLRCGACFKIHTDPVDPKTGMRRMFCAHCGSDMMQRVSASVDGRTGRLKLFFSKKKQNKHTSARGTKFSLPKPGTGNRFQGDLLLREDQLLMGAWNQKVKKNSGGQSRAHAQSIFGKDIASNVGCGVTTLPNDIQVGFGRRNPNSAKGRERRGKKKKSSDRACGLRRY